MMTDKLAKASKFRRGRLPPSTNKLIPFIPAKARILLIVSTMKEAPRGFTLIELAIVLVVIGLLLGGILKGQELIESARARNLISQIDSIKAAYYAFQDKYRAIPGDYPGALAHANLSGIANDQVGGNGDGVIRDTPMAREGLLAWVHLSHANLISGNYQASGSQPDPLGEWPRNPYGATLRLQYDDQFTGSGGVPRLNLKTGGLVPARILAEIDRKIDDGRANSGQFRFSAHDGGGGPPSETRCFDPRGGLWRAADNEANCGAAALF
jgi:prepilin-type N-terminal cleavage/methylation domain-containing protein